MLAGIQAIYIHQTGKHFNIFSSMSKASIIPKGHKAPYKCAYWFNDDLQSNPAFFAITKNASTTMRNTLGSKKIKVLSSGEKLNRPSFTIIRNPVERFPSSFLEISKSSPWGKKAINEETLIEFIDTLKEHFFDTHVLPQVHFVSDENEKLINLDYWLLFDNLEKEFKEMLMDIGISDKKIKHDRKTAKGKLDSVVNVMTPKVEELIIEIYNEDWKLYNKLKNERK